MSPFLPLLFPCAILLACDSPNRSGSCEVSPNSPLCQPDTQADSAVTDTAQPSDTTPDDTALPDGADNGGSLTRCDLSFIVTNEVGKGFGESCDNNDQCRFGACVKPGTGGNITNGQFGFCSRGCDCENDNASRLTADEKLNYMCLYPAGFRDFHHVVVRCDDVGDCQALDSRYTQCKMPDTGGIQKVCHAI